MEILGIALTGGNIITIVGLVVGGLVGYTNLKNDVKNNTVKFNEIALRMNTLESKVDKHETEVGVVNAQLSTIQAQMGSISSRLDTLINHLLRKGKDAE